MRSQRPYLLRALHEWIVDSACTPHLLVDSGHAGVQVPSSAVRDGRVVLNVAPEAVRDFLVGDDLIEFQCRFGGVPHTVLVPMGAVLAIYARENGAGMAFEPVAPDGDATVDDATGDAGSRGRGDDDDDSPPPKGGGHLRVVK